MIKDYAYWDGAHEVLHELTLTAIREGSYARYRELADAATYATMLMYPNGTGFWAYMWPKLRDSRRAAISEAP